VGKGGNFGAMGAPEPSDRKTRANVTWSADSKAFYVVRTDSRGVKDLFLVDSIANPRPKLEQYKYPMPAESDVRKSELHYCDVEKKALTRVSPKWKDERYSDIRWGKSPGELRFIRRDRLRRNLEVCSYDVFAGQCKCMFGEAFESAYLDLQAPRYLDETDELIWWSERSGWGHFYRYGARRHVQERDHFGRVAGQPHRRRRREGWVRVPARQRPRAGREPVLHAPLPRPARRLRTDVSGPERYAREATPAR
jgi:hypothetical protein